VKPKPVLPKRVNLKRC